MQKAIKHNILIAPSGLTLSERIYAKIYNLVSSIASANKNKTYELIVNRIEDELALPNVTVKALNEDIPPRWKYHFKVFNEARRQLLNGDIDIYHHMDLSPPWFNPLLMKQISVGSVIGPIQAPHSIPIGSMEKVMQRYTGIHPPETVARYAHKLLPLIRRMIDTVRKAGFRRNLRYADQLVAVNEAVADYCSHFVDNPEKIKVIPYGVDMELFSFNERDPKSMDIVAIGMLKKRKGFQDLLNAFPAVIGTYPNAQLHIFGKGPQRETLEAVASKHGIEENVTFHGYVSHSQIKDFLADCRLFVHPSYSEGYSHVRLEALASGCPVVGTDIMGANGMIVDEYTGLTVQPGDTDGLARSIIQLLSADERLVEMSHNCREHVAKHYSFDQIGQQWADVYDSIIG